MEPWRLTDAEWEQLRGLLVAEGERPDPRGRKRLPNERQAAEACLFRHHHSLSESYRCFGWNQLPRELGISPSTANRRYREWTRSGAWLRFWSALLVLRAPVTPAPWEVIREPGRFPAGDIVTELERAYAFFNIRLFGGQLPAGLGLVLERQRSRSCRGYFCARVWRAGGCELGQISIHASILGQGSGPTLAVLLHEMVHLRNNVLGLGDADPVSQYHNRHFRDLAAVSGLACGPRHARLGYAHTALNELGRQACADFRPQEPLFRWNVY